MSGNVERIRRLLAVERECDAALVAIDLLTDRLRADPSFLLPKLKARDAASLLDNAEATFLIRLFAEFEAGLRDVWYDVLHKSTRPNMEVLIDRIAARNGIAGPVLDRVHEVRLYRNALVHTGSGLMARIDLKDARGRLCRFLSLIHGW